MYRFLVTPRWWGINIFALVAIPFCLFMGSWQLSRFDDRVENHQQREEYAAEAQHAQAAPLSSLLPVTEETVDRTARVTGQYDTRQLLVPERSLEDEQGYYVLNLLRPEGGGAAVPVVRGWLPGRADASDVPPVPRGRTSVEGVLQAPESQEQAGPSSGDALPSGQVGFISPAPLINLVPYDVEQAWLTVQDTTGKLRAVPPSAADNSGLDMKAFQNLGYTAEWFVFAGFVVFMWFRFFRRDVEVARDSALGLHPDVGPAVGAPHTDEDPQESEEPDEAAHSEAAPAGDDDATPHGEPARTAQPAQAEPSEHPSPASQ